MILNSVFGYTLLIFDGSYLIYYFSGINPLDTVMCSQMLNNDYDLLEKGIY